MRKSRGFKNCNVCTKIVFRKLILCICEWECFFFFEYICTLCEHGRMMRVLVQVAFHRNPSQHHKGSNVEKPWFIWRGSTSLKYVRAKKKNQNIIFHLATWKNCDGAEKTHWRLRPNSHNTASRSNWKERKQREILSVTIDRWHSRLWGQGFWFWAGKSVCVAAVSSTARSFPRCGGPRAALCSVCDTGSLSYRTPLKWSFGLRWRWWWSRSRPPHCGSPGWSEGYFPGNPPASRDNPGYHVFLSL